MATCDSCGREGVLRPVVTPAGVKKICEACIAAATPESARKFMGVDASTEKSGCSRCGAEDQPLYQVMTPAGEKSVCLGCMSRGAPRNEEKSL